MRNIKLIIEYNGRNFNGWQKQPNKLNIQGELEKVIGEITGEVNTDSLLDELFSKFCLGK